LRAWHDHANQIGLTLQKLTFLKAYSCRVKARHTEGLRNNARAPVSIVS